jgi:uncharacterized protein (DUF1800 family)
MRLIPFWYPSGRVKLRLAASVLLALVCVVLVHSSSSAKVAVLVSVSPAADTLAFNATRQFTATVTGAANTAVAWTVNDIPGGNSTVGTISAAGLYTAPASLPATNPVTIKATSVADPMAAASATVTVRYPTPVLNWWSPSKVPLGTYTFTLYGSNFYNGAVVKLDGVALPTTYVSSGQLKATSNVMQSGSGYVTVTNLGPAAVPSSQRLVEFGQGITMSITPATATVNTGASQQFTVNVQGAPSNQVWWYVNGGSANGTMTSGGLYKAPNTAPASPVTIRAVLAVNSERQASATVTVTTAPQTVAVAISPTSASVPVNTTRQFTASVTGSANTAVTWQVSDVVGGNATVGTISATGLYTAPAALPGTAVAVSATSQADPTKKATALVTVTAPPAVAVTINPAAASVQTNATQQFTATVSNAANTAVTWQVNGVAGGNTPTGTISATGLYTAPAAVPAGAVTVSAVSQADPTKSASASVTVTPPPIVVTISVAPSSASIGTGATQQFTATVGGTANTAVTWQVNNVTGGSSATGTISATGLYTAPAAVPAGSVTVKAISQADPTKSATASVNVTDPLALSVGRFLDQATFGPTPALTAHVKQVGIQHYLDEQFAAPESVYPNGVNTAASEMYDQFYWHKLNGQDQLRQRMVYALGEIIVISRNKNYYPNMLIPWLQILSKNAFGNYRTLLKEITLDASMGNFLDMVNSFKPGVAGGANENYARELMQLFSIGLYELNPDGSQKLDANNKPIPTYTMNDVRQVALALTGWTYNTANGAPQYPNPNYYPGPLVPLPNYHDFGQKTFLGKTLPAGQTMQKDVDDVIDAVFNHPNTGPFIVTRLIRALVTSNPSPAYIARMTAVFNDNGLGVRGDLKAVLRAVLLDPDARNDAPPNDFGRLRTPLQHHIALFRALGGAINTPSQITYVYENMGEGVLNAPSVFGHYSPMFRIPKQSPPLFGPEFQIHGPGELVNSGNLLWNFMSYYQTGIWDLQWLFTLGSNHTACVDAVDNLLLYGRMSAGMRQQLLTALQSSQAAGADAKLRALTVLYLTAMSSEYLVIR